MQFSLNLDIRRFDINLLRDGLVVLTFEGMELQL